MNIKDIVAKLKDGEILANIVKVENSYIPLILKRSLVNSVANMSLLYDEDTKMLTRDNIMQELFTTLFVTLELSDVEIDNLFGEESEINIEVALESYDMLMQHGIYNYICERLSNNDIDVLIEWEVSSRLESHNSVAAVLSRTLQSIISILPSEDKLMEAMKSLPTLLGELGTTAKKSKK